MAKAAKLKQLGFTMPNRAGLLSEITAAIAGAKVTINSICAYEMENNAHFMLTTDSNAKTRKALAQLGIEIKEDDVIAVEVPNKAGELHKVAKKIVDAGININYLYGTAGDGKSAIGVFKASDNTKAVMVINK